MTNELELKFAADDVAFFLEKEYWRIKTRIQTVERELFVTPFDGHYGNAGFIFAVNGSPPKGVAIVITNDTELALQIHLLVDDKFKLISESKKPGHVEIRRAIMRYLNAYFTEVGHV